MKVLIVTAMYPNEERPAHGVFVKDQVESLRKAGVIVDVFNFDGRQGIKSYLGAALKVKQTMLEKPYDIVHSHYGLTGITSLFQTYCPTVVTFHGSDLLGEVGSQYHYTLKGAILVLMSRLGGLLVDQRIIVADVLRPKLWPKSSITIPMGVDFSRFKPMISIEAREKLGFNDEKKRILFLANPKNHIKRFDIAQSALDLLKIHYPNVELIAVYNVDHNKIPIYMNACNVLVLTSMHEASPCVIKEALACDLPIVSVDVGDVAERINGIEGCYLCDRTPQDVADKLKNALDWDRPTNGREKIKHLSLENVAWQIISVYENLLSST